MLSGIRTLKAYGYEEEAVRQFEQYDAQLYDAGVKAQFYGSLANPSTRFVMNTAYAAVGGAGALLALAGQITIGSISSFLMYSNLFSKPFTEISGVMTQLQSAVSSAQRVFDLLDEPQEDADGEQVLQVREGRVDFLHVRFGYEPGQPLMKDITLHVPAGSRVAIVGRTGAGKTTLVNLLMRFYEIEGGQILIDDQDIRRCTRDSLRRQFGMVLQDTCLFEGTIAENIAFGKPEASRRDRRSGTAEAARIIHPAAGQGYESLIRADSDMLSRTAAAAGASPRLLMDRACSSSMKPPAA
ncbi:MAG: ATP-binding cassette domain-containing protein [Merdibacter sp.]